MDDEYTTDNSPGYDGTVKKEWLVQKFPIKGGSVIRSAMQIDLFYKAVTWATVEGKVKS